MTNAEKYLKPDMRVAMWKDYNQTGQKCKSIWQWLDQETKPTLTEDERVILKNIDKKYSIIYRDNLGRLEVKSVEIESTIWKISMVGFNHVFKFIKNGEEYEIAELLKGE